MDILLKKIEKFITSSLLLSVTFLLFINVILRIFGKSLDWVDEFARYGIIWMTFIGGSICVYKGAHIGIDSITALLNPKSNQVLKIITNIIALVFTLIFTVKTFKLVAVVFSTKQLSTTLEIPMWFVYGALPLGGSLMIIRYLQQLISNLGSLKKGEF